MYVFKVVGELALSSPPKGVYGEALVFRLEARFSKHPSTQLQEGGKYQRVEKIINTAQLDPWTFSMCLEEFADQIRDLADEHSL